MVINYEDIDITIKEIEENKNLPPGNDLEDEFLVYGAMYLKTKNDVVYETLQNIANQHFFTYNYDHDRFYVRDFDQLENVKPKKQISVTFACNEMMKNNVEKGYYNIRGKLYGIVDMKYKREGFFRRVFKKLFRI